MIRRSITKNIVSSTKRRCLIHELLIKTLKPGKWFFTWALLHNLDKTSIQRINKYGERKSPCRKPLVRKMWSCGVPLSKKEYETEVTHSITQEAHVRWRPDFPSTARRKFHSTRSYALLMSVFIVIHIILLPRITGENVESHVWWEHCR